MKEYFKIIRQAISQERKKSEGVYYEAHHIIPKSFGKKSTTVLLTPREHYTVHRLLADYWKSHTVYGKKMLWAFHRLAYDGKRKLTEEEYEQVRVLLVNLWRNPKSVSHRQKISKSMIGNTNNSSRVFKGMKTSMTEEGRSKLATARRNDQTGKTGLLAKACKGPYTLIFESGMKVTAESYQILSHIVHIPVPTLRLRVVQKEGVMYKGWSIRRGK